MNTICWFLSAKVYKLTVLANERNTLHFPLFYFNKMLLDLDLYYAKKCLENIFVHWQIDWCSLSTRSTMALYKCKIFTFLILIHWSYNCVAWAEKRRQVSIVVIHSSRVTLLSRQLTFLSQSLCRFVDFYCEQIQFKKFLSIHAYTIVHCISAL